MYDSKFQYLKSCESPEIAARTFMIDNSSLNFWIDLPLFKDWKKPSSQSITINDTQ